MVEIEFINNTNIDVNKWNKLAQQIFQTAFIHLKLKYRLTLSITFLTSDAAKQLNQQYRHKNYIPDVLSFPTNLSKKEVKTMQVHEIGDLFICIEEAKRKMVKYNHTLKEEMAFLFIHGFLHLLNYDHEKSVRQEKKMFKLQTKILALNEIKYEIKFNEVDYIKEGL